MDTRAFSRDAGRSIRQVALMAGMLGVAAIGLLALTNGATAAPGDADLSLTKSDSPDPVSTNGTLTYTIAVANGGPLAATSVVVTDTLDNQVDFVSASSTAGTCSRQGKTVTCDLGTLAATATATVTIVVKAPKKAQTISNTATVASPEDNTAGNNSDTETTSVVRGPTCRNQVATIVGTPGDDSITGTNKKDVIVTGAGNDVVRSGGGNDIVCTGTGNDLVRAGGGADFVSGGRNRDKLVGNKGNDVLKGKRGPDRLLGKSGSDRLNGGRGKDKCKGGSGKDTKKSC